MSYSWCAFAEIGQPTSSSGKNTRSWPTCVTWFSLRSGDWLFYDSTHPWQLQRRPSDSSPRNTHYYMQVCVRAALGGECVARMQLVVSGSKNIGRKSGFLFHDTGCPQRFNKSVQISDTYTVRDKLHVNWHFSSTLIQREMWHCNYLTDKAFDKDVTHKCDELMVHCYRLNYPTICQIRAVILFHGPSFTDMRICCSAPYLQLPARDKQLQLTEKFID